MSDQDKNLNDIPKTVRKVATFLISPMLLKDVLNIPVEYEFLHFSFDIASDCLRVYVEGEGLPEVEVGQTPQNINPIVTKIPVEKENGNIEFKYQWDWNIK